MRILTHVVNSFALLRDALLEIFDETAYQRFLVRHNLPPGQASYAGFCREHDQNKVRRPKCC